MPGPKVAHIAMPCLDSTEERFLVITVRQVVGGRALSAGARIEMMNDLQAHARELLTPVGRAGGEDSVFAAVGKPA